MAGTRPGSLPCTKEKASHPELLASGGVWVQTAGSVKGGVPREGASKKFSKDLI